MNLVLEIILMIRCKKCANNIDDQVEAARRLTSCSRPRAKEGIKVETRMHDDDDLLSFICMIV